jgi:hypothetical protein
MSLPVETPLPFPANTLRLVARSSQETFPCAAPGDGADTPYHSRQFTLARILRPRSPFWWAWL